MKGELLAIEPGGQVKWGESVAAFKRLLSVTAECLAWPMSPQAATLHPDAIDPHRLLADAYTQLGRAEDASRELSEAERIRANGGSRLGTQAEGPPEEK